MNKFAITPTKYDSKDPSKDPIMDGRIYLCVEVESGRSIPCQISGWVRPEVAAFIKAAPDLLEAARAAWNCIGELPPTQARVEVGQMLTAAIAKATGEA